MRSWLQLMRFPAVFTAISNIVAAQLIATAGRPEPATLLLLTAASCCIYLAGMVLNDCFDLDEDRRERPSRPLPSGRITLVAAWRVGWGLLLCGVALAALAGSRTLFVACLLAVTVVLYDGVLKRTPLGSAAMATCRCLNWWLGLSSVTLGGGALLLGLPIFLYIGSLTLLSRQESTATDRRVLFFCGAGVLLSGLAIFVLGRVGIMAHEWAVLLVVPAVGAVLWRLSETARTFTPASIQGAVKFLLLGVIPLDAIMVFAGGPWWGGFLVLCLLVPGNRLARRIYVT